MIKTFFKALLVGGSIMTLALGGAALFFGVLCLLYFGIMALGFSPLFTVAIMIFIFFSIVVGYATLDSRGEL